MEEKQKEPKFENPREEDLLYKYNRELFYSFDKDHKFSRKLNYQNNSNQIIIKQSWDAAEERLEEVKQKVLDGKLSPIAFFMEKNLMDVPMLAAYMEIWKMKVRRHLKPSGFSKLKPEVLKKYADVFGISPEELKNPHYSKHQYQNTTA